MTGSEDPGRVPLRGDPAMTAHRMTLVLLDALRTVRTFALVGVFALGCPGCVREQVRSRQ